MVSHCRTLQSRIVLLYKMPKCWIVRCSRPDSKKNLHNQLALCSVGFDTTLPEKKISENLVFTLKIKLNEKCVILFLKIFRTAPLRER